VETPVVVEKLDIERIPINQYVDSAPPAVRYEGDVMIVPILEEVVVVEKRLRLVEELRITKRQEHTQVSQPVVLRKEEVTVDRRDNDVTTTGTASPNAVNPNSNPLL
jgi:stress response protein YsnF